MLKDRLQHIKIVLASGSPRRQQFFRDLHLDFEVRLKEVDEIFDQNLQREEITRYLSELKASALKDELQNNELLITSDTIVWHNGQALGKPVDRQDAINILRRLSGSTHEVITSVCFTLNGRSEVIDDITEVSFNHVSDKAIEFYLDEYKPYDKAGAYGIQDWIGLTAVRKISGSYANVMGMPTDKVYEYLLNLAR